MDESDVAPDARHRRFTQLFSDCYVPILAFARRRVGEEAAQDVVAETFLTAWRHFDELSGDPLPWLYRVAGHVVANQRRAQSRRARLEDQLRILATSSIPDPADTVAERRTLIAAFGRLSERDREVLCLAVWEGLEPATAASVLGCSTLAFNVRLHRARRRFSRLIADEGIRAERPHATPSAIPGKELS